MCSPIAMAVASFGLGAAQSIMGYRAQKQQFERDEKFYEENKAAAGAAAISRYASLQQRMVQENEAASSAKLDISIDAARARGSAVAAAAEGGVRGLSVDNLVNDIFAQRGRMNTNIDRNAEISRQHLEGEMEATYHQGIARVHGVAIPEAPSIGAMLLGVAGAGLNAYSAFNQFKLNAAPA